MKMRLNRYLRLNLKGEYILIKDGLIYDFFAHPMRIFFIFAGILGILGASILGFRIGDFVGLHQFIFLELFCAAAFCGFLFTAVPDWTGFKKSLIPYSIIGFTLLILALVSKFAGFDGRIFVAIFWLFLALSVLFWLIVGKNYDNFALVFLLFTTALIEILPLFNGTNLLNFHALLHCYTAGIILIGFRVSITLGRQALNRKFGDKSAEYIFIPNPILKNISLLFMIILSYASLLELDPLTQGFIAFGAGLVLLSGVAQWHHRELLSVHYTVIYYVLILGSGILYSFFGLNLLFGAGYGLQILHGITIWTLLGFVFFIFNVSSLRHSGQIILNLPICGKMGLGFLFIAAISRLFLTEYSAFYITIPAIFVGLVFLMFSGRYFIIYKNNPFTKDPD